MRRLTFHAADELLVEYALGGLVAGERLELEQHLEGCRRCTRKLAETADTFAVLADVVVPVVPAQGLKDRLFGSIAFEGGRA